jgi:hypothetical protein
MTTQAWSTRIRHDSDANFREWGLEISTKLAAAGLVQAADTGQVNWATVTRTGVNTNAGYEIWRFDDAMQATAPIFLRVDYGTGSNANGPRIQITVGTGSNGSGTITGTALTSAQNVANSNGAQTSDTARNSYMCHAEGFFGFNWKVGSALVTESVFFICRTSDPDGTPNEVGALVVWANGSARASQALRFEATAQAFTVKTTVAAMQLTILPQTPSSTAIDADLQAMVVYTITPRVTPVPGICGIIDAEFPVGNTFTATLVGSTSRTYLALSPNILIMEPQGVLKTAMLWE